VTCPGAVLRQAADGIADRTGAQWFIPPQAGSLAASYLVDTNVASAGAIAHRAPEQSATLLGVAALNPFAACHPPEHHDTISEKGLVAIA
jgi:hypothetical protein